MRPLLPALLLMAVPALSPLSGQSFVVEKPEFRQLVPDDAVVEKLAGGFKFVEGPAWNPIGSFLVFSDIPADKMYRFDPALKDATVFREPSFNANGNFYTSAGRLVYLRTRHASGHRERWERNSQAGQFQHH